MLERERQAFLNREQYEAEDVLIVHAINVIAELPVIRQPEIVRCKDCGNRECDGRAGTVVCGITGESHSRLWFCADGELKEGVHE